MNCDPQTLYMFYLSLFDMKRAYVDLQVNLYVESRVQQH